MLVYMLYTVYIHTKYFIHSPPSTCYHSWREGGGRPVYVIHSLRGEGGRRGWSSVRYTCVGGRGGGGFVQCTLSTATGGGGGRVRPVYLPVEIVVPMPCPSQCIFCIHSWSWHQCNAIHHGLAWASTDYCLYGLVWICEKGDIS